MELPFNEDEVTIALFDCCGDKTLGPYDMTMVFLQANWDIVKADLLRMFFEFFSTENFVARFNATFIGLILKKENAKNTRDF